MSSSTRMDTKRGRCRRYWRGCHDPAHSWSLAAFPTPMRRRGYTGCADGIRVAPDEPGGHFEPTDTGYLGDGRRLGSWRVVVHTATTPQPDHAQPADRPRSWNGDLRQHARTIRYRHHLSHRVHRGPRREAHLRGSGAPASRGAPLYDRPTVGARTITRTSARLRAPAARR